MKILETKRFYLRRLSINDAENFYHLNANLEVLKYTGDLPFENITKAASFLATYDHYQKYGFGRWAVIHKTNDLFLGWCGLKYTPTTNEYDIGFRFFKKYWNKGYATESAKACIDLGFNTYKMPEIVGRCMKANIGSIKVLEKIGLSYCKPYDFEGKEGLLYKIKNKQLFNKLK